MHVTGIMSSKMPALPTGPAAALFRICGWPACSPEGEGVVSERVQCWLCFGEIVFGIWRYHIAQSYSLIMCSSGHAPVIAGSFILNISTDQLLPYQGELRCTVPLYGPDISTVITSPFYFQVSADGGVGV